MWFYSVCSDPSWELNPQPPSLRADSFTTELCMATERNRRRSWDLLHEVLVRHHVELLRYRLGYGHQEDVDARLSGQRGRLLQVVRGPAVDQHDDHPRVASPGAVLLAEEGPGSVRDGFTWQSGGGRGLWETKSWDTLF